MATEEQKQAFREKLERQLAEGEQPKSLTQYCTEMNGLGMIELVGIRYCRPALGGRDVLCPYISKIVDHNGLRRCMKYDTNDAVNSVGEKEKEALQIQ